MGRWGKICKFQCLAGSISFSQSISLLTNFFVAKGSKIYLWKRMHRKKIPALTAKTMPEEKSTLVYSTDKAIPRKKPMEKVRQASLQSMQRKVTVRLDRKGRSGKSVTVIDGLRMPQDKQEVLLKQLKMMLGTGGTVKDTSLEIQGDHRDVLMEMLEKMGYKVNRSGG
jgi:translation initiation factor 1